MKRTKLAAAVSALALAAGGVLSEPAKAQIMPLETPPATPEAPMPPVEIVECALEGTIIACAPGFDPDGIPSGLFGDSVTEIQVSEGAFLNDGISTLSPVTITNDGTIFGAQTGQFLIDLLGSNSVLINNGFIQTTGLAGEAVLAANGLVLENNGTISTTGSEAAFAINAGDEAEITNTGLIQTDGSESIAVSVGNNSRVTNTSTGSIITTGADSIAVRGGDMLTIVNDGLIQTFGEDSTAILAGEMANITVNGTVFAAGDADAIEIGAGSTITVGANGRVDSEGNDGIQIEGDGVTITNNGIIRSNDDEAIEANGANNLTVINNGTIIGDENGDHGIEADENLTVINTGLIESINGEAIEAQAGGLNLNNSGMIIARFDDAVDGDDDVTIVNTGLIQGNENDAIELNSGTITNSGTIISLASDPEGTLATPGGMPELDAAIDFDAGTPGNEDGMVINMTGGLIEGDVGIVGSPGNVDGPTPNMGAQTVINAGTITGRMGDAVLLGEGDDAFEQQMGGIVNGNIELQDGNDSFLLTGSLSSISGMINGGDGEDTLTISGIFDADNFINFETIALDGATISGARVLEGDITLSGTNTFNLGEDTLFVFGDLTLAEMSAINVTTDVDITDLFLGAPILVFDETGTFTDNGAAINVIDNDLLVDYTVQAGSLFVIPQAVNPGAGSTDGNALLLGNTLQAAFVLRSLDPAFANIINDLPDLAAFEAAANGLLPSVSTGISRELFENSNTASRFALDRLHDKDVSKGIWGQFHYRTAERNNRSQTISGYDADSFGFTGGFDARLSQEFTIGVLGSYADSDINETNGSAEQIDLDFFKIAVYGGFGFESGVFLNGELGYVNGDFETSRRSIVGIVNGAFNSDGFTAQAELGYDYAVSENFSLVPTLGVNFLSLGFDEQTEFGGLALGVTRSDVQFIEGRAGLTGRVDFGGIKGFVRGVYAYDFDADPRTVQLTLLNAPSFVISSDEPAEGRFEVDAGLNFDLGDTVKIALSYTGEFADEYTSHGGLVRLRFGF